jgi:hypothetical protein
MDRTEGNGRPKACILCGSAGFFRPPKGSPSPRRRAAFFRPPRGSPSPRPRAAAADASSRKQHTNTRAGLAIISTLCKEETSYSLLELFQVVRGDSLYNKLPPSRSHIKIIIKNLHRAKDGAHISTCCSKCAATPNGETSPGLVGVLGTTPLCSLKRKWAVMSRLHGPAQFHLSTTGDPVQERCAHRRPRATNATRTPAPGRPPTRHHRRATSAMPCRRTLPGGPRRATASQFAAMCLSCRRVAVAATSARTRRDEGCCRPAAAAGGHGDGGVRLCG